MSKKSIQINEIMQTYSPEYFLDENAEPHVKIKIDGVMRAFSLRSVEFEAFVQRACLKVTNDIVSNRAIQAYKSISSIEAGDSGIIRELPLRVAKDGDNIIYNLSRQDGKQVLITPDSWQVVPQQKLFKHQGLSAPLPIEGGSLDDLERLLNISDNQQKLLVLVTLMSCFIPDISHPLMILTGEQGSAKTTMSKIFKMIVDPGLSDVTHMTSSEHNLELIMSHSYVTAFDNLSSINETTSDFLCRVVTGQSVMRRRFYKDDALRTTKLWRCIILNGINSVVRKPDLLDRAVLVELRRISDSERKCDEDIFGKLDASLPGILGAIFTIISNALKIRRDMVVDFDLKRLADFTKNGYAIAEAIGAGKGKEFLRAYTSNINSISAEIIESNPLVLPLIEYLNLFESPATVLVSTLHKGFLAYSRKKFDAYTVRHLPQTPSLLSRELKSCIDSIEKRGIILIFHRGSNGQYINILRNSDLQFNKTNETVASSKIVVDMNIVENADMSDGIERQSKTEDSTSTVTLDSDERHCETDELANITINIPKVS